MLMIHKPFGNDVFFLEMMLYLFDTVAEAWNLGSKETHTKHNFL